MGTPKYQRELHEFCGDAFDQWIMTQLDEFQASTGIQLEPSLFKEARSQFVEKVLNDFTTNQDLTTLAQCIKNSLENNSLAQAIQQSESQGKYIIEEVCGQRFDKWLLDQLKLIPESLHVKLPPILFAEAREKFIENATNHFEKNNDLNGLVAFIEQYLTQHSFKKTLTDDQKELEELSQHVIHFKQSVDEEQLPDRRIILQLVLANLQEEIAYRLMRDMAQSDQCRDMFYLKVFRQSELLFHIQTNFLKLSLSFPNLILNRERIFDYIQYINQINGIPHPSFSAKEEHIGEEFSKFWENLAELKHPSVQIDHLLSDFIEDEDLLHDLNKLGPYKADFIRQLHAVGFLHDFSQQLGEDFLTSIDSYSEDKKHLCSLIRQKFPLYEQEIKNFLVTYKHFVDLVSKSEQLQDEGVFFIALSKRLNSQAMFGKNFENQVILLQRVFQVYDMILGLKTHIEKRSAGLPLDQRLAVLQSLQEGISGVLANPESSWQELNFNFARELNKAKASLISLNDYKSDSTLFGTIKAKIVTPRSQKLVDTLCKEIDDVIDLTADKTGVIKQYKAQLQADRPSQTELISAKKL